MEKDIWRKMIIHLCDEKKEDRYGFTIPFIVGLERYKNNRQNFLIQDIFLDLVNSNDFMIISYCDDLQEIIIGKHKRNYPNLNTLKRIDNLIINIEQLENLNTTAEILEILEKEYNLLIQKKLFSKNLKTNEWNYFDDNDEILIKKLLNY